MIEGVPFTLNSQLSVACILLNETLSIMFLPSVTSDPSSGEGQLFSLTPANALTCILCSAWIELQGSSQLWESTSMLFVEKKLGHSGAYAQCQ